MSRSRRPGTSDLIDAMPGTMAVPGPEREYAVVPVSGERVHVIGLRAAGQFEPLDEVPALRLVRERGFSDVHPGPLLGTSRFHYMEILTV